MHFLLFAALLGAVDVDRPPPERLLTSEVTAGIGLLGTGYTMNGARWGDLLLTPTASARGLFGGFTVEGGASVASPLASNGVASSLDAELRAGWSGQRWALVGGVHVQLTPGARPAAALLPTLRLDLDFGTVGFTLGVLDHLALMPAHLDVKVGRYAVGWVAPLGLLASADFVLHRDFGLRVLGFIFKLGNSESAMLMVSGTWGSR